MIETVDDEEVAMETNESEAAAPDSSTNQKPGRSEGESALFTLNACGVAGHLGDAVSVCTLHTV